MSGQSWFPRVGESGKTNEEPVLISPRIPQNRLCMPLDVEERGFVSRMKSQIAQER